MSKSFQYAIIGGGIGGLTLAIALQRKGLSVKVYENAPAWKSLGAGLGLAGNAMKAFREIGIEQEILRLGKVIKRVYIKDSMGRNLMATDSEEISRKYDVVNNFAIHRADLHEALLSLLAPGTVELNKRCADFQQTDNGVKLSFQDGREATADFVVASDGVHSIFRRKLVPDSAPRYSGYTCWRSVVSNLPTDFDWNSTTESWGAGSRFGIVPLTNTGFFCFACLNANKNDPAMKAFGVKDLQNIFGKFHQPIPQLLARTNETEIIWSDIVDIKPLNKFAFGNVLLMGDAAHATTPNMGQGACMAIEDACVLSNFLSSEPTPAQAFQRFEAVRLARTTKIVNDSWTLGRVAQWQNPVLVGVRNWLLKNTPASATERQFRFIYDVNLR